MKATKPKKHSGPAGIPAWIAKVAYSSAEEIRAATNARLAFRALRKATGLTQPEFAQKLGVSLAAVQGAESGYRPVSEALAKLVQLKLGVFASSVTGATREPITILGEPASGESIARATAEDIQTVSDDDLAQFTAPLEKLVRAAASAGRLRLFGAVYKDTLLEIKEALQLEKSLMENLLPACVFCNQNVEEWSEVIKVLAKKSPEFAKAVDRLNAANDPARSKGESIEATITLKPKTPEWFPASPMFPNWGEFVSPSDRKKATADGTAATAANN